MPNRIHTLLTLAATLLLSACSTFVTPRYSTYADTTVALRKLGNTAIAVGEFKRTQTTDLMCRGAGPLAAPDGASYEQYIQRALADELKMAGIYTRDPSGTTINGSIDRLEFSSTTGLTGGWWLIAATLISSNGKSLSAEERYEFQSGFSANIACKQTAEAFAPATQNLIKKMVESAVFKDLLLP